MRLLDSCELNQGRPGILREHGPFGRRVRPRWLTFLVLLLLLLATVAATRPKHPDHAPRSLAELKLAGSRGPVPLSLVLLLDESGSFAGYQSIRDQVLNEVVAWAPKNLRSDDELTVIGFAGKAYVKLATISISELVAKGAALQTGDPGPDTFIQPVLRLAGQLHPSGRQTSVIAVTDTEVPDAVSPDTDRELGAIDTTSMSIIVPSAVSVTAGWQQAFAYEAVFQADPTSPAKIALAFGKAVAHATGQRIQTITQ